MTRGRRACAASGGRARPARRRRRSLCRPSLRSPRMSSQSNQNARIPRRYSGIAASLGSTTAGPAGVVCNSDTLWISETDSATNRESITILHASSARKSPRLRVGSAAQTPGPVVEVLPGTQHGVSRGLERSWQRRPSRHDALLAAEAGLVPCWRARGPAGDRGEQAAGCVVVDPSHAALCRGAGGAALRCAAGVLRHGAGRREAPRRLVAMKTVSWGWRRGQRLTS